MGVENNVHIWSADELRMKMDEPLDTLNYGIGKRRVAQKSGETWRQANKIMNKLSRPLVYAQEGEPEQSYVLEFNNQFQFGSFYIERQARRDLQEHELTEGSEFVLRGSNNERIR